MRLKERKRKGIMEREGRKETKLGETGRRERKETSIRTKKQRNSSVNC